MNRIWTIIKREYKESVFKKSFIISTLLTPILLIGMGTIPSLLLMMDSDEQTIISVYDESGYVAQKLNENLSDTLKNGQPKFIVNILEAPTQKDNLINQQKSQIENDLINGFLEIPYDVDEKGKINYYTKNVANFDINRAVRNAVSETVINKRLEESGFNPDSVNQLTKRVELATFKISKGGKEEESSFGQEYISTIIFVLILYVTLLIYGQQIMRSIVQEKTSRIVELILSSSTPFQFMAGKIFGQGIVGLTQYVIWAILGLSFAVFSQQNSFGGEMTFSYDPAIFIYFIIYFILGYFFYSTLFAGIGAVTNSDQEAQQLSFPVMILIIASFLLIFMIIKNPDSDLAVILSLIPFFTPILMFTRTNLTTPGILEIGASIIIMIIAILLAIWLVAKVYRVGILMYGKRPTLPEILNWVKK